MALMKQVAITDKRQVMVEEVPMPAVTRGNVLLKICYSGICGTDLMNYRGDFVWGRSGYPKYPGHELSGIVEAVGEGVDTLKVGDRVVPECTIGCGVCGWCKSGNYSLCQNRLKYSNGGLAERVALPAKAVHILPEGTSLLAGALIEPVAVGCNAALKAENVFGRSAGVIGGGTIGLGALMTLNLLGAAKTFLFDLVEERVALGRKLGATHGINGAMDDPVAAVSDHTSGKGLDVVVVASAGTAKTVGLALELVAAQGVVIIVGLSGGQLSSFDADDLCDKEATIIGSHSSPGIWEQLVACVGAGRYDLEALVSHVIPLDKAAEAFALLDDPKQPTQKVVLEVSKG
ncbi:MAG: alcohol dehydrogenase catalytic domain-containing protein [Nitrospiraceae bacterium]|nr:alcohol dehydrogenase catalytic domain-containing protein [Nitrospiraceae bacterium]